MWTSLIVEADGDAVVDVDVDADADVAGHGPADVACIVPPADDTGGVGGVS